MIEFLWWAGEIGGPEPVQISERAMTAACRLVDGYFVPMAERVYGDAAIPTPERHAMTLARHLRRAQVKSFNARKLRREVGGVLRDTAAMDSACATLEEAGLIKAIQAKRVGRPSRNYIVNAAVQGTTHE